MGITILADVTEPRVSLDRIGVLADGGNWDPAFLTTCGVDAVTKTAMLRPLPLTNQWWTGPATGSYVRIGLAEYNLATPANWREYSPTGIVGDSFLYSLGTAALPVVATNASLTRNRGVYLAWYCANWGAEQGTAIECGWVGVGQNKSLRILTNGDVQIWDRGTAILTGNIRDNNAGTDQSPYPHPYGAYAYPGGAAVGRTDANLWQGVCLIPCRRRELLVVSPTSGGGFTALFDDIPPDEPDPEITASGPFWWYVPQGQAVVQLAPLRFNTSGTVVSAPHWMYYAPGTAQAGAATVTVYSDQCGYGSASAVGTVFDTTGTVGFPYDGTAQTCRVGVVISGDGTATPWVYGAGLEVPGTVADTYAGTVDLTTYTVARQTPRLDVPETPEGVRFAFTVKDPLTLDAGAYTKAVTVSNRPLLVQNARDSGTVPMFVGRTGAPKWTEAISDEARDMELECRDYWVALEQYRISDPIPFDGMNLGTAMQRLLGMAGFGSAYWGEFGTVDFTLPRMNAESNGEWALLPEVGDTAADWLLRLQRDYYPTAYMGWVPTAGGAQFRLKSTAELGTAPVGTVWFQAGSAGTANAPGGVVRRYQEHVLQPEANEIRVIGRDPRTELPIVAVYTDTASQSPGTAPADRPANWLGEPRKYSWVNPAIIDQDTANWCCTLLAQRLTPVRRMAEWECEMLWRPDGAPAWRGDCVCINGTATYRIDSLSTEFGLLAGTAYDGWGWQGFWLPTRYVGEKVS